MDDTDVARAIDAARPYRLPPSAARVFVALWLSRGRIVTHSIIADRIRDVTADYPTEGATRTAVKRLRRAIEACRWPVEIESVARIGYRLEVIEPGWTWEVEA